MTASRRCFPSLFLAWMLLSTAAAAQEARWEVEVHGGGILSSGVSGDSRQLPAASAFTASSGRTSRRVSSWYFGEGADLLTRVSAQLAGGPGLSPLDAVLTGALADPAAGAQLGFRVSRSLSPRLALEFTFDYSAAPAEIDVETAALLETSRASFVSSWTGILQTGPFVDADVAATSDVDRRGGRRTFATATLNVDLRTEGRLIPYLLAGGGVVSSVGEGPTARLEGRYAFDVASGWQGRELDRLSIRHDTTAHGFTGVVGGGVKWMATRRWGVRLDARLYLSDLTTRTILDANPEVATLTPVGQVSSVTFPSLQLSNNPITGFPSSLSGPGIEGVQTFEAGGVRPQLAITGGLLWRF